MGKKILIVDAGCTNYGKGGTLSHAFAALAKETLEGLGHTVDVTTVDREFDPQAEAEKIAAADSVIFQVPGWWMYIPWQLKKYQDLVFVNPKLCGGDGRHRDDPEAKYGTGGFLKEKTYLLSTTWNAPLDAFEDPKQFFEGRGLDGLFMPFHKTMAFIGMQKLPSFMVNDVFKHPTIEADMERFKAHLKTVYCA